MNFVTSIPDSFNPSDCSPEQLLHDLQVRQADLEFKLIELEVQNEHLRSTQTQHEESDGYYADLFNNAPVGHLTLSENELISEANIAATELLGIERHNLLSRRFASFVAPDDDYRWYLLFAQLIRHNETSDIELVLKDSQGKELPVQLNCLSNNATVHISFTNISKIKQTEIVLRDVVSHRKLLENQLSESEQRFRRIADVSPAMIWITDVNGTPTFVNQTWLNFTGIERAESLSYNGWVNAIHPDDREYIFLVYYQNIQDYTPILTEYRLRGRNGEWRWILDHGIPLHDDNGVFTGYIGSAIDITERKVAATELRVAAVAFESQESIMITDAASVILRVNKAFTETTGYEADEVIGKTPSLLKSGRHSTDFYAEMWETLRDTGAWQGEIYDRRKNGEIYPKFLTITAVKGDDGAVTHYVGAHLDITLSKAATAEIERLAFYDPLTELPNRRLLQDRLKLALASSNRSDRLGALLFIDLDKFKTLNDTLGHKMGDLLLQQVAQRLESCVREGDTIARLGGDEFVVILEDLSERTLEAAAQAEMISHKILDALNQPFQLATHNYKCTSSIGATLFNEHDQSADELLKQADMAMYQAKDAGRNAMRFFDQQMQISMNTRVAMEADLRLAIKEIQFELYYQPQVNHNCQIIGAEVLIRWQHPQNGLISPAYFIPLAEATGLILPIGLWVLETACMQIKNWESHIHTQHLVLAINVSARQFHLPDFVKQVHLIILRSGINPERLKLELTEDIVIDNINDAILKMNALRELGVKFSMDDFGTGYSSLAYLTQLPFTQLKIDQSFVRNIDVKGTHAVIIQTIIGMGHNLGMTIIAEGVETEQQRDFLLQNGCTLFQGYLFSKPVAIEQFEFLLKQG